MLLPLRKSGLNSLFKEVRVFKGVVFGTPPPQKKKNIQDLGGVGGLGRRAPKL